MEGVHSLDKNDIQLEVGDNVIFAGKEYTIENIILDPKQDHYCTAELDMANGIRAYCYNVEKIV